MILRCVPQMFHLFLSFYRLVVSFLFSSWLSDYILNEQFLKHSTLETREKNFRGLEREEDEIFIKKAFSDLSLIKFLRVMSVFRDAWTRFSSLFPFSFI